MTALTFGDPYIPTPRALVRAKLKFGEISATDTVFDLGCGDGRVLIMAAREFRAKGVGVEIQKGVVEEAWSNVEDHDLSDRVEIVMEDYMATDLSRADLVILYSTTRTLHRMSDKLRELKPGARIVTHDFALPGWTAEDQTMWTGKKGQTSQLFLYRQH